MKKTREQQSNETVSNVDDRMCWTIKTPDGEPFMQIRPYSSELCYQLYEWGETKKRTGELVKEWKPLECYPSTIARAAKVVYEYMVKRCGKRFSDIESQINRMIEISNLVVAMTSEKV